jgi:hypothetical protein
MSEHITKIVEVEYRETDFMAEIRKIMLQRGTGQMTLNMSEGRICSVVWREKQREYILPNGTGNGHSKKRLDMVPTG